MNIYGISNYSFYFIIFTLFSCGTSSPISDDAISKLTKEGHQVQMIVLGTIQDGGSPHIGCQKACCSELFKHPDPNRMVVSLGVIDQKTDQSFLFEATPDLPRQIAHLQAVSQREQPLPDGIFITHAHIGHYTGLMYLGKESFGANGVPVYTMPRMKQFLESNGPWDQLVTLNNIELRPIQSNSTIQLTDELQVTALRVPHRDEYSETVGYRIDGPNKRVLFIPDINKWNIWDQSIIDEIKKVDFAFIDATFYDQNEIPHRDMSEIPHPFLVESMQLFDSLPAKEKSKIYFIHLNHSNPLLDPISKAYKTVIKKGYRISKFGQIFEL